MHRTAVPLILAPWIATACLVPFGAVAQTATSATGSSGTASVETAPTAGQLADRYSTVLGARADALKVIEGLRAGKDSTLGSQTVSGTGTTMGYGAVGIALALADASAGTAPSTQDFLASLDRVMDLRAAGTGWGQIARELGLQLGQVVSGSAASPRAAGASGKSTPAQAGGIAVAGNARAGGRDGSSVAGSAAAGGGNGNAGGHGGGGGGGGGGRK